MRCLLFLLLCSCSPTLDLDGPHRICVGDGGCDGVDAPDVAIIQTDCDAPCERFARCVEADCEGDPAALLAQCDVRCHEIAGVAQTLLDAEDCATTLEAGAPELLLRCVGERCGRFAGRLTGCVVAECAAAGTIYEGLNQVFEGECEAQVDASALRLSTLDSLESDACGAAGWAERVSAAVSGDGPGDLGPLCTTGPVTATDVCELSCDVAVECLDAETAPCLYGCATQEEAAPAAACMAEVEVGDCDAAEACATTR